MVAFSTKAFPKKWLARRNVCHFKLASGVITCTNAGSVCCRASTSTTLRHRRAHYQESATPGLTFAYILAGYAFVIRKLLGVGSPSYPLCSQSTTSRPACDEGLHHLTSLDSVDRISRTSLSRIRPPNKDSRTSEQQSDRPPQAGLWM